MKRYQALIIILLVIAFLPFCYVCLYALPYADDFCIGWELLQGKPLLTNIAEQYLYWNGRYTSDVLINLHPINTGNLIVYSVVILVSLLATPVVFYVFLQQVLKHRVTSVIVSLLLSLIYLNYMPQITEGIYWYGGIVNYHIGVLVLLVQLTLFIKLYVAEDKSAIQYGASLLLLVASVGFNEVGAMLIPLFYFILLVFNYKSLNRKLLAIHFIVALIASAFVIFSPGNATRLGEFSGKYDLLNSVLKSSAQTLRFSGGWLMKYPMLVCSVLAIAYAHKLRDTIIAKIDWRIALTGAFAVVFIAAFIPYFATGILGQHRTVNYEYPFFLLLWFIALIGFANRYSIQTRYLHADIIKAVLLISAIITMQLSYNARSIYRDIRHDGFNKYKTEYLARQQQILDGDTGIKPLQHVPSVFMITDATAKDDPQYWVNKCMKLYYEKSKRPLH